jgi:uncharacterized protein YfkK (UPF0435 family)
MTNEIAEKLDHLSGVLVHAINYDRETVADLSDWYARLSQLASQTAQPEMAAVTKAAALVLEKMVVDDSMDESPKILSQKTREFWSYQARKTRTVDKDAIKALLINELENINYFHRGDTLCRETLLNPAAENVQQKLLV